MKIFFPTLSSINADFLFGLDERDQPIAPTEEHRLTLSHVANEALGFERNDPKDYAWRIYGLEGPLAPLGMKADYIVAIATIGDREIIFTC